MRFNEFKPILNEVSMKPGTLKKLALAINGMCGIEFELFYPIPPETELEDDDIYNFDQIETFFTYSDANSLHKVQRYLDDMFSDYVRSRLDSEWKEHSKRSEIEDYILKNIWDINKKYHEIYKNMNLSSDEIEQVEEVRLANNIENKLAVKHYKGAKEIFNSELEKAVEESIKYEDDIYHEAYSEWYDENADNISPEECLSDLEIHYMSDFSKKFRSLSWPVNGSTEKDQMQIIASNFMNDTGYNASSSLQDKGDKYVVEEDSSLDSSNDYIGAEIVSPVLSIGDMVEHLHTVVAWAKRSNCKTNSECGLHMNVSIQDFDLEKLDYVKLALFLGDEWVLNQFNRIGNDYCISAISNIRKNIQNNPTLIFQSLNKMKEDLATIAGNLIHSSKTDKYTSINVHDNRIEVRSPGGDWLNSDISVLENMLYRFIVALDIACDPEKEKKEYAKKFYQLTKASKWSEFNDYFSQYQAGIIDLKDLKPLLTSRVAQKQTPVLSDNSWNVISPTGQQLTVVANTQKGAINQVRAQLKLNAEEYPDNAFTVEPNKQLDIFRNF